ncbi:hypothetical protein CKM354_000650300 [Cercospora kikuchii]|uniref:2EXR domain-containing protein n=1 Tax=Cercospora kikuchii TaxID=84275 RepID=A0A9P3CIA4_9PEZI|nr:uncharacterized protein CKM354_000650300 [Cercospora kikuchii]GIZ43271.1 hypothetical protein CKM354_000650300 [Cercospora kikuchii]
MAILQGTPPNKRSNTPTGRRQPGQTKPLPELPLVKHKSSSLIAITNTTFPLPSCRLKDIDLHKLTLNLPNRQRTGKWFSHLPSPAGLFSTLPPSLRRKIFTLAMKFPEPFVIHAYRDEGNRLAHGPYVKRKSDNEVNSSSNGRENLLALTRVSKAIRYETHLLFYQLNTYYINHDPDFQGNDAKSILTKFRTMIGEEAFQRIRGLGFCCQVRNERVSRVLWPRAEIGAQVVEIVKRCVGALNEVEQQQGHRFSERRWGGEVRLEICLEGLMKRTRGKKPLRLAERGERMRKHAQESFSMRIQLDLGLPTCMWDRHLAKWAVLADEAERRGDTLRARGLREVVKEMRSAEGKLESVLPLQRRI